MMAVVLDLAGQNVGRKNYAHHTITCCAQFIRADGQASGAVVARNQSRGAGCVPIDAAHAIAPGAASHAEAWAVQELIKIHAGTFPELRGLIVLDVASVEGTLRVAVSQKSCKHCGEYLAAIKIKCPSRVEYAVQK